MQFVVTSSRARNAEKLKTGYTFRAGRLTISKARKDETYRVAEFVPDMDGRAFTLTKSDGDHYSCLVVNSQDGLCECRGFEKEGHCKHLDTLRAMLAAGELDAEDGRPDSPFPSPEQLAADAGEDLPF
jgi:hypothetical protein